MSVKDLNLALTTAGLNLNAKIQAGDGKVSLEITDVVTSSDTSGDPLNMAVSDVKIAQTFTIIDREIMGARAAITVLLTNIGNPFAEPPALPLMTGYTLSRILFFANDPDEGEIVYRVSQFSYPNYVPSVKERPWTMNPTFNFVTGDASDVNITVDPKGLATMEYVNKIILKALQSGSCVELSEAETPSAGVKTHYRIIADAPNYMPSAPRNPDGSIDGLLLADGADKENGLLETDGENTEPLVLHLA